MQYKATLIEEVQSLIKEEQEYSAYANEHATLDKLDLEYIKLHGYARWDIPDYEVLREKMKECDERLSALQSGRFKRGREAQKALGRWKRLPMTA